jgi:hypothetical protein
MKLTPAKKAKADFLASLPSLGWTQPADRFGHYKMTVIVEGSNPVRSKVVRLKIQSNSWRVEHEMTIPATTYSSAEKHWVCLRHGYFNDPKAPTAKVPTFKA